MATVRRKVTQRLRTYIVPGAGPLRRHFPRPADRGPAGWLIGFLIGHPYALYTWTLWPVLARSTARQISERRDWAKTEREPIS